jgi:hypothetical protein
MAAMLLPLPAHTHTPKYSIDLLAGGHTGRQAQVQAQAVDRGHPCPEKDSLQVLARKEAAAVSKKQT